MADAFRLLRLLGLRTFSWKASASLVAILCVGASGALASLTIILQTSLRSTGTELAAQLGTLSPLRVVGPQPAGGVPPDVVSALRATAGVDIAAPVVEVLTLADGKPALVLGIDCEAYRLLSQPDCSQAQLASTGLTPLGVGPGIAAGSELLTSSGTVVLQRPGAVFEQLNEISGGRVVALELSQVQRLFSRGQGVDAVYLGLAPGVVDSDVRALLTERLPRQFAVLGPGDTPARLVPSASWHLPALVLLTMLVVVLGAMLAHNAIEAIVDDRQAEFALLAALGGSRAAIGSLIIAQAVAIGLAGGLVALALGVGAAYPTIHFISGAQADATGFPFPLDVRVNLATAAFTVVIGVLSALVAAVRPARHAVGLDVAPRLARPVGHDLSREHHAWRAAIGTTVIGFCALAGCWIAQRDGGLTSYQVLLGKSGFMLCCGFFALATKSFAPLVAGVLGRLVRPCGPVTRLAVANLRGHFSRTGNAVVAVAAVVATTILVSSLVNGASAYIARDLGSPDEIQIAQSDPSISRYLDTKIPRRDLARLDGLPEVGSVMESTSVLVGHRPDDLIMVLASEETLAKTELVSGNDDPRLLASGHVFVGTALARARDARPGESLTLLASTGVVRLPVAAIVNNASLGGRNVQMSMALLRDLYGRQLPDYVSMSPATGTSLGQLRDAVTALSEEVDSHFMVSTADAANRERRMEREMAVFAPVTVMTRSLYLLSYVALLATILLSVTQRRHEFKTLRALGFHRRDLVRLMVTEAGFVALVGVAEGMILGIVLGKALFFVMPLVVGVRLESHLGLGGVAASAALVTLVAVLAALGPAARVTRHHAVAR